MDSASPIAKRTAGQTTLESGNSFILAMWTDKAEKFGTRWSCLDRFDAFGRESGCPRPYREYHRRSYGEGRLA